VDSEQAQINFPGLVGAEWHSFSVPDFDAQAPAHFPQSSSIIRGKSACALSSTNQRRRIPNRILIFLSILFSGDGKRLVTVTNLNENISILL